MMQAAVSRIAALSVLAGAGFTRKEAAERTGLHYGTVHAYAHRYGLKFARPSLAAEEDPRANTMAALYREGRSLQQIGEHFGLTRERVRQILKARFSMSGRDGGKHARGKRRLAARMAVLDAKAFDKYGCTHAEYKRLLELGCEMKAAGFGYYRTPIGAFRSQRNNAIRRGIGWELKLWQWWTIWQDAGCWDERGRGRGYCMCRVGDSGPYAVGNVYIDRGDQNMRTYHARRWALHRESTPPEKAA